MNGQEKDDVYLDLSGMPIVGASSTAEYWEYDGRLGRRWNIDLLTYTWHSPYACFNNSPVYFSDPNGLKGGPPDVSGHKVGDVYDEVNVDSNGKEYSSRWYVDKDENGNLTWKGGGMGINLDAVSVKANEEKAPSKPELKTVTTFANSIPTAKNDKMFLTVTSLGVEAALIGGVNASVKQYQLGENHLKLYSGIFMSTRETDFITGLGVGVGVDFSAGVMNDIGPWENPLNRILNATDFDYGLAYGAFRGGYNSGDGTTYDLYSLGVGAGIMEKGFDNIKKDMPFAPFIKNGGIGAGLHDPVVIFMSKPTFADSVRTALNNRGDSISESFLKRNPSLIPKCLTCK